MVPYPPALRRFFRRPEPGTGRGVAFALFERIATPREVSDLLENGGVVVKGFYAPYYIISATGQTAVLSETGELVATGCIGLVGADYPCLDNFITNFLLAKSREGERIYWTTAVVSGYSAEYPKLRDRVYEQISRWHREQPVWHGREPFILYTYNDMYISRDYPRGH